MKTIYRKPYGKGELRIGWSSWNENEKSVKWAYPDKRGCTSIRSPEVPLNVLVELLTFALHKDLLSDEQITRLRETI
ncbi:hypothetical protein [Gracilibacillus dipsosauri]|uniref:hypothetical protein n=1 Tax=Gracilibacillus dipsosauri TaxID=178340 RepID=UPI002409D250